MAMNKVLGTYEPDNLFAANQELPAVADALEIAANQDLKRGCLVDADGNACESTTTGEGDEAVTTYAEPYAVLAEDCDTTEGAKEAAVYLTGEFNIDALSAAADEDVKNYKLAARKVGIFMKKNI